ncbi:hypothetical protein acdb102_35230 [Acidothermaceae bacterium B102]|nr:hypothetical protein acdb102_35230 [Acidothermaceae bacterium B102]
MMRKALRQLRSVRHGDDEGFSLMETLVASTIFGIFTTLVMLAIISMLNDSQKNQSLIDGQSTIENVFQKLDHQVRYANGIQTPGQLGGNWFVEWQAQPVTTQPQTCTQLKFNPTADTLQERTWQPKAAVIAATPWVQIARNITNPGTTDPFTFTPAGSVYTPTGNVVFGSPIAHQQLTVTLMSQPNGTTTSKSTLSTTTVTFTALNSTSQTGNVCQEVARS